MQIKSLMLIPQIPKYTTIRQRTWRVCHVQSLCDV
jgi:hypothetical protein